MLGGTESDSAGLAQLSATFDSTPTTIAPQLYSLDGSWKLVKEGLLNRLDIRSDDVMCVDVGAKIFITVGQSAPSHERRDCMQAAQAFLAETGKPSYTPIVRVEEGKNANDDHYEDAFEAAGDLPEPEPEEEPKGAPPVLIYNGVDIDTMGFVTLRAACSEIGLRGDGAKHLAATSTQ